MSGTGSDYGEIVLDGMKFALASDISVSAVDRFPGKVTIGDYSLDSNDILSSWVISDSTGGNGVVEIKEGVDDNRYRFGTLYTRYPLQYTLPFATYYDGTGVETNPLGDMYYSAVSDYEYYDVSGAVNLFRDGADTTVNITARPTDKSVSFIGTAGTKLLYIPQGASGYSTYNRAANTIQNVTAGELMQSFCLWDNKLIGIDTSGQIYYATAAAATTTFTSYGADGKLDTSYRPYSVLNYYNRSGELSIFVVTDSGVFVFDPATPRLYLVPNFGSVHKRFGLASAVWNQSLYVSAGMDILEFNGNVVRNIGLSRDDGLPWVQQGFVSGGGLAAGQNALYALVKAGGSGIDGLSDVYSAIYEWSGIGWHCINTEHGGVTGTPLQNLVISRAQTSYRLHWGLGNGRYYIKLPETFTNPREDIAGPGTFKFGRISVGGAASYNYYIELGRFNAGMNGYIKIASSVLVHIRSISANQTVVIKYRINNDVSYTTLGTATSAGNTTYSFGTADSDGIYPGIAFDNIEFRMEFTGTAATEGTTQVAENLTFSFLKVMNPSLSWTAQVDLESTLHEQSPANMLAKLTTLRTQGTFFTGNIRGTAYRMRLAGFSGSQGLDKDTTGQYTLSLIEVPSKLGAPV